MINGHLLRNEVMDNFLISDSNLYMREPEEQFKNDKILAEYDFNYDIVDSTITKENLDEVFFVDKLNKYSKDKEKMKENIKYLIFKYE